MDNESDLPGYAAIFTTVVTAIVAAFLVIAAVSPNVSVDLPGVSRCPNGLCPPGGGD
jgi:hypothetical protein